MKAQYASYREIPHLLKERKPFEGSTMWAMDFESPINGGSLPGHLRYKYIVFSYGIAIAGVTSENEVVLNETKYSQTTSKHQKICREHL